MGFKLFETHWFRFSNKMVGFWPVTRVSGLPWDPGPCLGEQEKVVVQAGDLFLPAHTHTVQQTKPPTHSFTDLLARSPSMKDEAGPDCIAGPCRASQPPPHLLPNSESTSTIAHYSVALPTHPRGEVIPTP